MRSNIQIRIFGFMLIQIKFANLISLRQIFMNPKQIQILEHLDKTSNQCGYFLIDNFFFELLFE